jgi:hypothetical protein
MKLIQEK